MDHDPKTAGMTDVMHNQDSQPQKQKITPHAKLLQALHDHGVPESQLERLLKNKGVVSPWSHAKSMSPKLTRYILEHLDAMIQECKKISVMNPMLGGQTV